MSRRGGSRRALILLGLGLGALAAVAGARWRDLARAWYQSELCREPGKLLAYLEEPVGSLRELALRDFVRSAAGARTLVDALFYQLEPLRETTASLATSAAGLFEVELEPSPHLGLGRGRTPWVFSVVPGRRVQGGLRKLDSFSQVFDVSDRKALRAWGLLTELAGREVLLSRSPWSRFTIEAEPTSRAERPRIVTYMHRG